MAYFCLTMLDQMTPDGANAATHFGISKKALRRIRNLSSAKGEANARKAGGGNTPYLPEEEPFLESAIPTLVRRAAEVEYGPDPQRRKITQADI